MLTRPRGASAATDAQPRPPVQPARLTTGKLLGLQGDVRPAARWEVRVGACRCRGCRQHHGEEAGGLTRTRGFWLFLGGLASHPQPLSTSEL